MATATATAAASVAAAATKPAAKADKVIRAPSHPTYDIDQVRGLVGEEMP
jgi:hypothetical protein